MSDKPNVKQTKEYQKEYQKKWRVENSLQNNAKRRKRYKDNPTTIQAKVRARNRKLKYGMTDEEFYKLLALQNGVCACCGRPEIARHNDKLRSLSVDHDHLTGQIRGLLCTKCNTALGLLDENIDKCYMLINYIRKATDNV